MSIARIYTTKKVRKDWTCGKCGAAIKKGVDGRISFAVGFRGWEQTRCTRPECRPTRSELESSAVASIYDAQDSADIDGATTGEDLTTIRDEIVEAVNEVASEYESNEMYEINEDLQERVSILEGAASELENWEPEGDEPDEDDERFNDQECTTCDGTGDVADEDEPGGLTACDDCNGGTVEAEEDFETAHDEWMEAARDSLREAVDGMELP